MKCLQCGIEFEGRADAKYCSPKCRKDASRQKSVVTDNVTLSNEPVTLNFEFYTITVARDTNIGKVDSEKSKIRKARYWYDVPLGAVPVVKKDWPPVPDFMNARQYFLWWKNDFALQTDETKAGYNTPMIHNPFKKH